MNTQNNNDGHISIVDAVETLSNIADLDFYKAIDMANFHHLVKHTRAQPKDGEVTIGLVKQVFKVVLDYLDDFYRNKYDEKSETQSMEGVRGIMLLVGEAARKLDGYTHLFHKTKEKSVRDLSEYKKLQEFYLNRVIEKVDEETLSQWVLALSKQFHPKEKYSLKAKHALQTAHVFVDMDSVKKDTDYELFYIRKEDGSRFFNPRLIRNMKVICELNEVFPDGVEEGALLSLDIWRDRAANGYAKQILKEALPSIDKFCKDSFRKNDSPFVKTLKKALMALFLAANPNNLSHNIPLKNCADYLHDFQVYLRESLKYEHSQEVLQVLSYAIYTCLVIDMEFAAMVRGVIESTRDQLHESGENVISRASDGVVERLKADNALLERAFKTNSNGPLHFIMQSLDDGDFNRFDPLLQNNLPSKFYELKVGDGVCEVVRCPSPNTQEFIQEAPINPEFKEFLKECITKQKQCLLFNYQDRITWREQQRALSLEELADRDEFIQCLSVVTLPKDTEFYYQSAPYNKENNAEVFKKELIAQVEDPSSGFYIPQRIKEKIPEDFLQKTVNRIHQKYFSGKNILLQGHRQDFIEIFYLFFEQEIIRIVSPQYLGFVCKDGVDVGGLSAAQYFIFNKHIESSQFSEEDYDLLDMMLYAPSMLIRERLPIRDRFNRFMEALKAVLIYHS